MEIISDLKTFSKILEDKGYGGLYHEKGGRSGTISEILKDYLLHSNVKKFNDTDQLQMLSCLGWIKNSEIRWECKLLVKRIGGKFFLDKIIFEKIVQNGKIENKFEFNNLTVITAPSIKGAVLKLDKREKKV